MKQEIVQMLMEFLKQQQGKQFSWGMSFDTQKDAEEMAQKIIELQEKEDA